MAMIGFKFYERRATEKIQAQPLEGTIETLVDENGAVGSFKAGDYLILSDNKLYGETKEVFEATFQAVRAPMKPLSDDERAAKSAKAKATREANALAKAEAAKAQG